MVYSLYICFAIISSLFLQDNSLIWKQWDDISYANTYNEQKLSIFLPKAKTVDKLPAIVFIGNESPDNVILSEALRRGFATVKINYRNSLKYPFPVAIQDVNEALKWLKENGRHYNIATDKLILCGASQDGYLAALAGTTSTYIDGVMSQVEFGTGNTPVTAQNAEQKNQNWIELFNTTPIKILCVIDFYGFTKNIGKIAISNSNLNANEANIQTDPITYVTPCTPPFLIIQGENDKIVPVKDAMNLYNAIKENLCPPGTKECSTQIIIIPEAEHGGWEFTSPPIIDQVFNYIKQRL